MLNLRKNVLDAQTDDGLALLDGDTGRYFDLNPTGALVLRVLLEGGTPADAARTLTIEYGIDLPTATRDVEDLLAELRAAHLLDEGKEPLP
ncbi:lasso peptide biosynthesis PqqD family chaperone [Nocardia sp. NPDC051321]|uniref:lasso peptide biosynthesis PqqD family chaperone n=1 Tax=Nocardia sp. NPDC051321 TaxID=3364323 RepID=UPI00378C21E5